MALKTLNRHWLKMGAGASVWRCREDTCDQRYNIWLTFFVWVHYPPPAGVWGTGLEPPGIDNNSDTESDISAYSDVNIRERSHLGGS